MRIFLAMLAILISFTGGTAEAKDKPFRRVFVVDSGSSYDTAVIVGVLNGLEKEMTKDDLIIATNASSLAAAIFLNFPLKDQRLEYLQSEKYFKFLGDWTIDPKPNANFLTDALAMKMRNIEKPNPALPALVGQDGIQHLPDPFELPKLKTIDWQLSVDRPALMLLATRVDFDSSKGLDDKSAASRAEWMKQNERGLFTLLAYSDDATLAKIRDAGIRAELEKAIQSQYGDKVSSLDSRIEFRRLDSIHAGIRRTLANPPLFSPVKENKEMIIGGVSQHDPVDFAAALARDGAVVTYSGLMGEEAALIQDIYGYDINEYRGRYRGEKRADLIHLESFFKGKEYNAVDMSLKVSFPTGLSSRLPKDLQKYRTTVQWLFEQGETLARPLALP